MSRYFPTTQYAEDQPLARTILTTHVLHRGAQTGAVVGITTGATSYLYSLARSEFQLRAALKSGHFTAALRQAVYPPMSQTILRHAGIGSVIGLAAMTVGLPVMMRGKEEIEWQDRSWRLMNNAGQLEVDDWSLAGAFVGALSSFGKAGNGGLRQVVGRTSVGSVVGVVGYLSYRYGVMKGERREGSISSFSLPAAATI